MQFRAFLLAGAAVLATPAAVLAQAGQPVEQVVVIGTLSDSSIGLGAGLAPGDQVIDNPPDSLQAGDAVRVMAKAAG